ncbi:uncharacterized protein [Penaeus vannamei]|uniref:uncharacterized protein n=1 Tax=Penaeus vannamei TaxID=6689 RepID=UPI00387F86B9
MAIDCEALAVVEAVRVFDSYLYGRKFLIYTDHCPLVYIFKHQTKSPRMTRYAHDLSYYDFEISCVLERLHDSALKVAHTPPLAMHPGIHRTYENLRNMFYWPNMLRDVRQYVEHCLMCQQSREVPNIIPLRDITASRVHHAFLDHWITYFGPPRVIQTDNGRQFTSNLFAELVDMLRASHHHPISPPGQWTRGTHQPCYQGSSMIGGEQPLYLLTDRHAYFPVGLTNDAVFGDNSAFQERLKTARRVAVMTSRASHETNEWAYNMRAKGTSAPEEGNLVWYKEMVPRPLGPRWLGPARISKRFGPVSFEVQHLDSGKVMRAHLNHLHPYHPPQELSYPDDNIDPDEEKEAPSAPDDPWVAILTTCVRDLINREPTTINGDEDN